ncbi:MAG: TRAP transporter small permease subunit [Phycisphaerales bacterium]|nr:TRAP transporter small permease subunit [Phycisphaerae bacterium]NNF42033.1 TRAP transporter small permease subunit [Phycisphaerales bacterium]NNM25750.1 TRAP transporter small permease subunit [Phycisphaerales bacterium]
MPRDPLTTPHPPRWIAVIRWIDGLNDRIGRAVAWLVLAMVGVGAFNAVARYLGRSTGVSLSSNAYIETQWYLFSLVFLLAAAYTLKRDAHVRVDVLSGRLGPRGRAWVDLVGTIVFLIPFCVLLLWVSWPSVRNSWSVRETSPDPGGLPRYPLKSMILVSFGLLLLQGCAEVLRRVAQLRGHLPFADVAATPEGR